MFTGEVFHFESIDSTNRVALENGRAGHLGEVFIADEQTAGRGRGGHAWHSRRGDGLYLSVLIRPRVPADDLLKLSFAAGLAAQEAVREVSDVPIDLRWPNDLVVPAASNRKCGGTLTETSLHPGGALAFCVIGIGINVNHEAMPADLREISTSLRIVSGKTLDRDSLAVALLQKLSAGIADLESDPKRVMERFASASTWVRGKRVTVAEDGGYTGITEGLSATGLLRVRCEDGSLREVRHGGVREA